MRKLTTSKLPKRINPSCKSGSRKIPDYESMVSLFQEVTNGMILLLILHWEHDDELYLDSSVHFLPYSHLTFLSAIFIYIYGELLLVLYKAETPPDCKTFETCLLFRSYRRRIYWSRQLIISIRFYNPGYVINSLLQLEEKASTPCTDKSSITISRLSIQVATYHSLDDPCSTI